MPRTAIVIGVGATKPGSAPRSRAASRARGCTCSLGRAQRASASKPLAAASCAATALLPAAVAMDTTQPADVVRLFDAAGARRRTRPELVAYNAGNALREPAARHRRRGLRVRLAARLLRRLPDRPRGGAPHAAARQRHDPVHGRHRLAARAPALHRLRLREGRRCARWRTAWRASSARKGLHVAHVVIDGAIDGDQLNQRIPQLKERLGADGMLAPDAIADAYWQLHAQPRSAWTLELDLRPYKESVLGAVRRVRRASGWRGRCAGRRRWPRGRGARPARPGSGPGPSASSSGPRNHGKSVSGSAAGAKPRDGWRVGARAQRAAARRGSDRRARGGRRSRGAGTRPRARSTPTTSPVSSRSSRTSAARSSSPGSARPPGSSQPRSSRRSASSTPGLARTTPCTSTRSSRRARPPQRPSRRSSSPVERRCASSSRRAQRGLSQRSSRADTRRCRARRARPGSGAARAPPSRRPPC